VVDVDDVREAAQRKITFVGDKEKAALNGITTEQIASTLEALLAGNTVGLMRSDTERNPLRIELRVPEDRRTSAADLAKVQVKGSNGQLVPLAELGQWDTARVDQTREYRSTSVCINLCTGGVRAGNYTPRMKLPR
jgi:multidrug efflux pump subunit AcrB